MAVMIILLAGLVISAVACVMIRNLLKASIMLAIVSAILSVIMFMLEAPIAAAFELSVCAGLITVVFMSAVSMTRVRTKDELEEKEKARRKRFVPLPVILIGLTAAAMFFLWPHLNDMIPNVATTSMTSESEAFWNDQQADIIGQIVIVLAGVYGVLIFFKEGVRDITKEVIKGSEQE